MHARTPHDSNWRVGVIGLIWIVLTGSSAQTQPATNCAPRSSGLFAWWPGDGAALDVVGTNHGTLRNGARFSAGNTGRAFNFDGIDDFVQVPNSPSLHFDRELTVVGWFSAATLSPE